MRSSFTSSIFRNMFLSKDWPINKFFLLVLGIFLFYVCYSIYIGSNSIKAICMDLIIQMKPYLAFFCTYQLLPKFNKKQKRYYKTYAFYYGAYSTFRNYRIL